MKILVLHPDLGIGGAERLIVDLILALQTKNYDVDIYTNHYDVNHAFQETSHMKINVIGDFIPRKLFNRFFYALFAYLRFLYLTLYILYLNVKYDLVICDQIPIGIPFLKLFHYKVLFYCHFPDMLLTKRETLAKIIYRYPIDFIEEYCMSWAEKIIVNSGYTASVVNQTFKKFLCSAKEIDILYPCIPKNCLTEKTENIEEIIDQIFIDHKKYIFLSINRYESKKNIDLAIFSFKQLLEWIQKLINSEKSKIEANINQFGLVIAGGYDPSLPENAHVYANLIQDAHDLGLKTGENIVFLKSISNETKSALLDSCVALCYTPSGEHFGIVPLEASAHGKPVIAVDDGGPRETVIPGVTGYLCSPGDIKSYAKAMYKCLDIGIPLPHDWYASTNEGQADITKKSSLTSKPNSIESLSSSSTTCLDEHFNLHSEKVSRSPSTITMDSVSTTTTDVKENNGSNEKLHEITGNGSSLPSFKASENKSNNIQDNSDNENDWDKVSPSEIIPNTSQSDDRGDHKYGDALMEDFSCTIRPENCIAHVTNNFSFEIFADRLNDIVQDLVGVPSKKDN